MLVAALVIGWYVFGLAGSALVLEFSWRRSRSFPLDIDVGDIVFGCVMAILGPMNFLIGFVFFIVWAIGGLIETRHVIFRKHEY